VTIALIVGFTWAGIIAAFLFFQAGRSLGRAEGITQAMDRYALVVPALKQIAEMVEATGHELDRQTKEQLDAIQKVAAWN
jgi:hypothetical protein